MFERFTKAARHTLYYARSEAVKSASACVEPEHLLLSLLQVDAALMRHLLKSDDAIGALRMRLTAPEAATGSPLDLPLSDASKRALAYGAEEADRLGVAYIGTEHLLAGLLREENTRAAQAMRQTGLEISQVRTLLAAFVPNLIPRLAMPLTFEHYTEKARRTIFYARYEAAQFGSPSIESEHLLLGLWREHGGSRLFRSGKSALEDIRKEIEQQRPRGTVIPNCADLPLSRECKHVLLYAAEEAQRLNQKHVGTGHLLAGLLLEENSLGASVLRAHGITLAAARKNLEEEGSST